MDKCYAYGSPDWWRDYGEFDCELEEGHEGPHRMTIEWEDPPEVMLGPEVVPF